MLYFVATPIGNLGDISFRAIETLKNVDLIACEDTRHSLTLLNHYGIKKPLISYHKFNENKSGENIIDQLKQGKNIAVITDAGMPVISDPGNILVNLLIENGLEYTIVPGASAFTSALLLSGLNPLRFAFLGFLPTKQGERREFLEKYQRLDMTLIFYSAPHDVKKDVADIYKVFGDRNAVAVREITKLHETVERFSLKEGLKTEPKGEYVLLVEGKSMVDCDSDLTDQQLIEKLIGEGMDKKTALKQVAKVRNVPKSSLYKYTIDK